MRTPFSHWNLNLFNEHYFLNFNRTPRYNLYHIYTTGVLIGVPGHLIATLLAKIIYKLINQASTQILDTHTDNHIRRYIVRQHGYRIEWIGICITKANLCR